MASLRLVGEADNTPPSSWSPQTTCAPPRCAGRVVRPPRAWPTPQARQPSAALARRRGCRCNADLNEAGQRVLYANICGALEKLRHWGVRVLTGDDVNRSDEPCTRYDFVHLSSAADPPAGSPAMIDRTADANDAGADDDLPPRPFGKRHVSARGLGDGRQHAGRGAHEVGRRKLGRHSSPTFAGVFSVAGRTGRWDETRAGIAFVAVPDLARVLRPPHPYTRPVPGVQPAGGGRMPI